jgi:hypothetical protein
MRLRQSLTATSPHVTGAVWRPLLEEQSAEAQVIKSLDPEVANAEVRCQDLDQVSLSGYLMEAADDRASLRKGRWRSVPEKIL